MSTLPGPGVGAGAPGRNRWRGAAPWLALALGLPLAVMGLALQANEYRSWGGSGVDCNGPFLLVFAVPAAIVYAFLALVFLGRVLVLRSWTAALAAAFSVLLVAGLWENIRQARAELSDPDHQLVCERR